LALFVLSYLKIAEQKLIITLSTFIFIMFDLRLFLQTKAI